VGWKLLLFNLAVSPLARSAGSRRRSRRASRNSLGGDGYHSGERITRSGWPLKRLVRRVFCKSNERLFPPIVSLRLSDFIRSWPELPLSPGNKMVFKRILEQVERCFTPGVRSRSRCWRYSAHGASKLAIIPCADVIRGVACSVVSTWPFTCALISLMKAPS
jgi:hypothetical protein